MAKKCIICGKGATLYIKGSSEYYCQECADEHFGDVSLLVRVEEDAKKLKKMIDTKIDAEEESEEDNGSENDSDDSDNEQ